MVSGGRVTSKELCIKEELIMTQVMVIDLMRNAFTTLLLIAVPILVIALGVGLIVSIFQATTQIQEQTLSFVPKMIAVLVALMIFGNFMANTLIKFTTDIFKMIPDL